MFSVFPVSRQTEIGMLILANAEVIIFSIYIKLIGFIPEYNDNITKENSGFALLISVANDSPRACLKDCFLSLKIRCADLGHCRLLHIWRGMLEITLSVIFLRSLLLEGFRCFFS